MPNHRGLLGSTLQLFSNKRVQRFSIFSICLLFLSLLWYNNDIELRAPEPPVDWLDAEIDPVESPAPAPSPIQVPSHTYREDGLLEVNLNGKHPIFDLIRTAEMEWAEKLKNASKSLDEAVNEYRRRYNRLPPVGFEAWWDYVVKHNVKLPDEYDAIFRGLEPFWGMNPKDLAKVVADWEVRETERLMVIGKVNGAPLQILKNNMKQVQDHWLFNNSVQSRLDIVKDVEHLLPDFRALINPFDNPSRTIDWELQTAALNAAASGSYIDINDPPSRKEGWLVACSPDSPARRNPPNFTENLPSELPPKPTKTFIYNHRTAMDPCLRPELLVLEGQFLAHRAGPVPHRTPIPQFASCITSLHLDLLPIAPQNSNDDPDPIAWKDKEDERLLWRGSNTGMGYHEDIKWRQSQRPRLVRLANNASGNLNIIPPQMPGDEDKPIYPIESWSKARVNPAMMDIGFVGEPIQCEGETCDILRATFDWKREMFNDESHRYKYIMDVDGNGWSSRFRRLLSTNSLVLKSTVYPEWFTDRIQPWVHYIPISVDYSDLYDAFIFFRGDLKGAGNHDHLAEKIASAGRDWTHTFWRKEDMTAYMFRMYLEYARVMSLDREAMTMIWP